jgi:hypothetical protein
MGDDISLSRVFLREQPSLKADLFQSPSVPFIPILMSGPGTAPARIPYTPPRRLPSPAEKPEPKPQPTPLPAPKLPPGVPRPINIPSTAFALAPVLGRRLVQAGHGIGSSISTYAMQQAKNIGGAFKESFVSGGIAMLQSVADIADFPAYLLRTSGEQKTHTASNPRLDFGRDWELAKGFVTLAAAMTDTRTRSLVLDGLYQTVASYVTKERWGTGVGHLLGNLALFAIPTGGAGAGVYAYKASRAAEETSVFMRTLRTVRDALIPIAEDAPRGNPLAALMETGAAQKPGLWQAAKDFFSNAFRNSSDNFAFEFAHDGTMTLRGPIFENRQARNLHMLSKTKDASFQAFEHLFKMIEANETQFDAFMRDFSGIVKRTNRFGRSNMAGYLESPSLQLEQILELRYLMEKHPHFLQAGGSYEDMARGSEILKGILWQLGHETGSRPLMSSEQEIRRVAEAALRRRKFNTAQEFKIPEGCLPVHVFNALDIELGRNDLTAAATYALHDVLNDAWEGFDKAGREWKAQKAAAETVGDAVAAIKSDLSNALTFNNDSAAFNNAYALTVENIQFHLHNLLRATQPKSFNRLTGRIANARDKIGEMIAARYEIRPSVVRPKSSSVIFLENLPDDFNYQYREALDDIGITSNALSQALARNEVKRISAAYMQFSQSVNSFIALQKSGNYTGKAIDPYWIEQMSEAGIADRSTVAAFLLPRKE